METLNLEVVNKATEMETAALFNLGFPMVLNRTVYKVTARSKSTRYLRSMHFKNNDFTPKSIFCWCETESPYYMKFVKFMIVVTDCTFSKVNLTVERYLVSFEFHTWRNKISNIGDDAVSYDNKGRILSKVVEVELHDPEYVTSICDVLHYPDSDSESMYDGIEFVRYLKENAIMKRLDGDGNICYFDVQGEVKVRVDEECDL